MKISCIEYSHEDDKGLCTKVDLTRNMLVTFLLR